MPSSPRFKIHGICASSVQVHSQRCLTFSSVLAGGVQGTRGKSEGDWSSMLVLPQAPFVAE